LDNGTICTPFVFSRNQLRNQLTDVMTKGLSGATFQSTVNVSLKYVGDNVSLFKFNYIP